MPKTLTSKVVQESHDQRLMIKSYSHGIATAGCFSLHDFTCIIKRETNYT
jgi:hypothetical protein